MISVYRINPPLIRPKRRTNSIFVKQLHGGLAYPDQSCGSQLLALYISSIAEPRNLVG